MNVTKQDNQGWDSFFNHRSMRVFVVLGSALALFLRILHSSSRFRVPQTLFGDSTPFPGRLGHWTDIVLFVAFGVLALGMVVSAHNRLVKIWTASWVVVVLLNPLKMLGHSSTIWWFQLVCDATMFLSAVAILVENRPIVGSPSASDPPN